MHYCQDIKQDPRLVWNLDAIHVNGYYGMKTEVFAETQRNSELYRVSEGDNVWNHLTSVVIASAAGDVLPPILIFEKNQVMRKLFRPLNKDIRKDGFGAPMFLCRKVGSTSKSSL